MALRSRGRGNFTSRMSPTSASGSGTPGRARFFPGKRARRARKGSHVHRHPRSLEKDRSLNADDGKGNFLPADKIYGSSIEANKLIYDAVQAEDNVPMDVVDKVAEDITSIVARDSSASLALASLRDYDEYTFTHSLNVCLLNLGQATSLGIEGPPRWCKEVVSKERRAL